MSTPFQTPSGNKMHDPEITGTMKFNYDATKAPFNITARSTPPSNPNNKDAYMDNGTNTASGQPGWRRYNGSSWDDCGAVAGESALQGGVPNALFWGVNTVSSVSGKINNAGLWGIKIA